MVYKDEYKWDKHRNCAASLPRLRDTTERQKGNANMLAKTEAQSEQVLVV